MTHRVVWSGSDKHVSLTGDEGWDHSGSHSQIERLPAQIAHTISGVKRPKGLVQQERDQQRRPVKKPRVYKRCGCGRKYTGYWVRCRVCRQTHRIVSRVVSRAA